MAAQLYSEFKSFFPENAVEYFVSYYDYYQPEAYVPTTDTFIEKDSSINEEIEKLRLAATGSLISRRDVEILQVFLYLWVRPYLGDFRALSHKVVKGEQLEKRSVIGKFSGSSLQSGNDMDLKAGNSEFVGMLWIYFLLMLTIQFVLNFGAMKLRIFESWIQ